MSEASKDLATRVQALEDRIAIEEIFHAYFGYGRSANHAGLTGFFAPDFHLDINGAVCTNADDLLALYKKVGASKPRLTGKFHMQLTNFLIKIDGDKATCQLLWTQQLNDTIKGPPRFIEQGREYDWLVKIDGTWKIKKRVVIADSGCPDCFEDTWKPRLDFSFETEAAPW
jgi:hypothetical protein